MALMPGRGSPRPSFLSSAVPARGAGVIADPEMPAQAAPVDVRSPSAVAEYLQRLHAHHAGNDDGEVATYIPELSHVDPSLFGICLATVDGAVYEAGDTSAPFTVQSLSKPLTYGLALERLGTEAVRRRIGVEPSGEAFNEISISPATGMPRNPLINAGAIAVAGLVASDAAEPFDEMLATYSRYAGRALAVDEQVYRSERDTGHRNRGMAHILRNYGVIDDPDIALDLYFRACSVAVDCRDLAVMAATLANGGLNPLTGERAVSEQVVRDVLSVMASCGMYDFAGEWLVSVGLPAKSGVSGGVLAVLPGRLGIAVFSPRLDPQGNSVRGIAVCRELSLDLAVHLVRPGERPASPLRAVYSPAERASKRTRSAAHREALRRAAARAIVVELQGELGFSAGEALARSLEPPGEPPDLVVVDVSRVVRADAGGTRFIAALAERVEGRGGRLALTPGGDAVGDLLAGLPAGIMTFADLDLALEWCEDELLRRTGEEPAVTEVELAAHDLLAGLTAAELGDLVAELGVVTAEPGALLVRQGTPASEVFLVVRGTLSVVRDGADGRTLRLTTLSAGGTFGELAFIDRRARAADVRADSEVICRTLPYATIDALGERDPVLHAKLLRNLFGVVVSTLHGVNAEIAHLVR
jgi:glutaminase